VFKLLQPFYTFVFCIVVSRKGRGAGESSISLGNCSGEFTRLQGKDKAKIDVTTDESDANKSKEDRKELPIWMQESTTGTPKLCENDSYMNLNNINL